MLRAFTFHLLLGLVICITSALEPQQLRVCTVLDSGFDELKPNYAALTETEVTSDDQLQGFDVDARKYLLGRNPVNYSVRLYPTYGALHVAVRSKACDVGWSAFFMTGQRESCDAPSCKSLSQLAAEKEKDPDVDLSPWRCCIDYVSPFHKFGTAIMYKTKQVTFWEALIGALTGAFVVNMLCFIFILAIVFAHLMWLVEHKSNSGQFASRYKEGIDDAIWWAIVTVTTVGYGDKVTNTSLGRLIAVIWMVLGIVVFSMISGSMAGDFTALKSAGMQEIDSVADLVYKRWRVCSYNWMFDEGGLLESVNIENQVFGSTVADCGISIEQGLADCMVLDSPLMKNWRSKSTWAGSMKISADLDSYFIAPIIQQGGGTHSEWLNEVLSSQILTWSMSHHYQRAMEKWFPSSATAADSEETYDYSLIFPAITLAVLIFAQGLYENLYQKHRSPSRVAPPVR